MINVVKPYLPPIEKYKEYIDEIYASGWITNNGPLLQELERRLKIFLDVDNLVLVANGTVALETAYRALDIKGEAITTPFSYVATTSSLAVNGINPIYADINPDTLNLDPKNIEINISKNTSAIVPTHVYGNACEVENIEIIAKQNNLKVIYDAAHAFGVSYKGKSLLSFGDISTLSFHATKLFHTIEGGAIIVNNAELEQEIRSLINFGIKDPGSISSLGTNAKMNEFEAAMGLCVLDDIDHILRKREEIHCLYKKELHGLVEFQLQNKDCNLNYSYFPIIFKKHEEMKKVELALNQNSIFPRRYFYPSLDTLDCLGQRVPMENSRDIAERVLCLPIYPELDIKDQNNVINCIKDAL